MLGYSGCGKSSSIKMLTDHYPQTIRHYLDDGTVIPQIIYITVSCMPHFNFSALYSSIGKAIDLALHVSIYERMIEKTAGLGNKLNKVVELIERFSIGIIIFDEIQLLDFSTTREASFESLMVIANRTKVAMCVVGTEDGYEKMFTKLRTARRLGRIIPASTYCKNKNYFGYVMKTLFQYQWFDNYVEPTQELIEAFHNESKGLIDQAVGLYIAVQDEYLASEGKKIVSPELIAKVSNKRYPNLKKLLNEIDSPDKQAEIQKIIQQSNLSYAKSLEDLKQLKIMESTVENAQKIDIEYVISKITSSILLVTELYSASRIESAARNVIKNSDVDISELESLTRKTFAYLQKEMSATNKPAFSRKEMLNEIIG